MVPGGHVRNDNGDRVEKSAESIRADMADPDSAASPRESVVESIRVESVGYKNNSCSKSQRYLEERPRPGAGAGTNRSRTARNPKG